MYICYSCLKNNENYIVNCEWWCYNNAGSVVINNFERKVIMMAYSNEELLDQSIGLMCCGGDMSFYHEILKTFVESEFINTLNTSLEQKDWKNYQITIHSVKSGAKTIGAMPLSELAYDVELSLKERNDSEYVIKKHPEVLCEIEKIEKIISELVD